MRSAPVAAHLSLAVVKLRRACGVLGPVLEGCLLDLAGVSRVRVDSVRRTIQILYDGEKTTADRVVRFLQATGWTRSETRLCGTDIQSGGSAMRQVVDTR